MIRPDHWRELYRTNDLSLARTIATCIEGMEFDVRLRDMHGSAVDESAQAPDASFKPPFAVDVANEHWASLREIVNDLIEEQTEFDSKIAADRQRATRVAQVIALSAAALLASFVGVTALKQCEAERP